LEYTISFLSLLNDSSGLKVCRISAKQKALDVSSNPQTTLEKLTTIQKQERLSVKIISVVALLSLFSLTMTAFAWGTANTTIYFLLIYPVLFITTILIIANIRFAYFLIIAIAISYGTLLNYNIGDFLVFNYHNNVLYLVLALPYFSLLTLVPLATSYLTTKSKHKKVFVTITLIIALGFPTIAIVERYNMDYFSYTFIDAKISNQGQVTLNCRPGFADIRTFIVTANSLKLADQIKKYGEYYQGSYFLHTTIKKKYRFGELKSVTLTKIDSNKLVPELTWTTNEIRGDISFLKP